MEHLCSLRGIYPTGESMSSATFALTGIVEEDEPNFDEFNMIVLDELNML